MEPLPVEQAYNWKTLSKREIYDNPWIKVTESDVINPNGGSGIYGVVHFKHYALGIIALDAEGFIYLVGQHRYPLNAYSWEIPEGGGKLELDPLHSAQRELKEETGLEARYWQKILTMHLSNSVSDEIAYIYLAQGLNSGEATPEETERLALCKIPFEEAYFRVQSGEITDSLTVAAILQVKIMTLEGRVSNIG